MELNQIEQPNLKTRSFSCANSEVVTQEECKPYFEKFNLPDNKVSAIKNSLVGIVDNAISAYLEGFK